MVFDGLVPRDGFYHFGIVARDFETVLEELGSSIGLEWASKIGRAHV